MSKNDLLKTLSVTWTGIRPLLMHNPQTADPQHPLSLPIKKLSTKRDKTDADQERLARLEWDAGLYWDENVGPCVPINAIEATIVNGARKSKKGKDAAAALLVQDDVVKLHYKGPREQDALYDAGFFLRTGVVIQKRRIMRTRPMFPAGWKIEFTIEYDPSILNPDNIMEAMKIAGSIIGLLEWRPKYGRFLVS